MITPKRTIKRRTMMPYRGRQIVLIIPPQCDYVQVRLAGTRTAYDVDLVSVYHLAVRQAVAAKRAAKKKK